MSEDNTECVDCGRETLPVDDRRAEWYIVQPCLWAQAGMAYDGGCLCIGCLETRIGRRLNADDFTDILVNDLQTCETMRYAWSWRTPRLINRLKGAPTPQHASPLV